MKESDKLGVSLLRLADWIVGYEHPLVPGADPLAAGQHRVGGFASVGSRYYAYAHLYG